MASIGRALSDARLDRDLSIEQVAEYTRISPRFLQALEREEFDELPAPVYVRGFLRSYANFLGLDPAPLLEELQEIGGPEMAPPESVPSRPAPGQRSNDPFAPSQPSRDPSRGEDDAPPQRAAAPQPPGVRYDEDDAWGAGNDGYDDEYGEQRPQRRMIDDYDPAYGEEVHAAPIASGRPTRRYSPTETPDEEMYRLAPRREKRTGLLFARDGSRPLNRNNPLFAVAGIAVAVVALVIAVAMIVGGDDDDADGARVNLPPADATQQDPVNQFPGGAATEEPTETASPTPETPVATETPEAFVMPSYSSYECDLNGGSCGDPLVVVCSDGAPGGFFIDIPGINDGYPTDWTVTQAASWEEAQVVCR